MSQPTGTQPCRRIHSRISRLIRFRTTAFPTFLVTVIPSLPTSAGSLRFRASASTCLPCSLAPSDWTARYSARLRSRISFVMRPPAMPTSSRSSPRFVCGPWLDDGEAPHGLHGSFCVHGSHACVCGSCCAADTYASRHFSGDCGGGSILNRQWGVKAQDAERTSLPFQGPGGSSIAVEYVLRSETRICYLRRVFSCGQPAEGCCGRRTRGSCG